MNKNIYRAIDANFNRSREGLRVCEEVARFLMNDKKFTRSFKTLRHRLENTLKTESLLKKRMLLARNVRQDIGKTNSSSEFKRNDAKEIFDANLERAKEATRALEEFFKLVDKNTARNFKEIRFQIYNLEKRSFEKLETLRNIR